MGLNPNCSDLCDPHSELTLNPGLPCSQPLSYISPEKTQRIVARGISLLLSPKLETTCADYSNI